MVRKEMVLKIRGVECTDGYTPCG